MTAPSLGRLSTVLLPAIAITGVLAITHDPIASAVAKPIGGSPYMRQCNKDSADCNHRCDFDYETTHVLSKDGYGKCQDKCDTHFANCVASVPYRQSPDNTSSKKGHGGANVSVGGVKSGGIGSTGPTKPPVPPHRGSTHN
jgi:hypothetical protein